MNFDLNSEGRAAGNVVCYYEEQGKMNWGFYGEMEQTGKKRDCIREIYIPEGRKEIEEEEFSECRGLINLILPESIQCIGKSAFEKCEGLKEGFVFFKGTRAQWEQLENSSETGNEELFQNCHLYYLSPVILKQPDDIVYEQSLNIRKSIQIVMMQGTDKNENVIGSLNYQWYENNRNSNQGGRLVPGAVKNVLELPVKEKGVYYYYCVVTEMLCGIDITKVSRPVKLTVI